MRAPEVPCPCCGSWSRDPARHASSSPLPRRAPGDAVPAIHKHVFDLCVEPIAATSRQPAFRHPPHPSPYVATVRRPCAITQLRSAQGGSLCPAVSPKRKEEFRFRPGGSGRAPFPKLAGTRPPCSWPGSGNMSLPGSQQRPLPQVIRGAHDALAWVRNEQPMRERGFCAPPRPDDARRSRGGATCRKPGVLGAPDAISTYRPEREMRLAEPRFRPYPPPGAPATIGYCA